MSTENWLPVVGFETRYEVSNLGNLRTIPHWRRNRYSKYLEHSRPVTQHPMRTGHLRVFLYGHGSSTKHKALLVHRLVLTAFVGECPEGQECCHGDGDPANNHLSNLRWGTKSENQRDSIMHGTHNSIAKAQRTRCRNGHEYTPENTYIWPKAGSRQCRTCVRKRTGVKRIRVAA